MRLTLLIPPLIVVAATGSLAGVAPAGADTAVAGSRAARATIAGRVTDTVGHGLANVRVFGYPGGSSTTTGRAGRYRLLLKPDSTFAIVSFNGARGRSGSSDATGYDSYDRVFWHLIPGAVKHLVTVRLSPAGALRGRVTDSAGHPLAGVEGFVQPPVPYVPIQNTSVSYAFPGIPRFRTNAVGRYFIKGVPAEAERVCFDASRTAVTGGATDRLGYRSTCLADSAAMSPGATRTLPVTRLTSKTGAILSGAVRAGGRPVARHVIHILGETDLSDVTVRTDVHGRYRVTGQSAGRYRICSWANGPRKLFPYGLPPKCVHVRVGGHGTVAARTLRIPPAGVARGRLVAVNGSPIAGAVVDVVRVHKATGGGFAHTGPAGRYRISGLLPGRYRGCRYTAAVKVRGLRWGAQPGECTAPFRVRARATTSVREPRLKPGAAIVGRVTDQNGEPATDAGVSTGYGSVQVDRDGRYRLTGLAPGVTRVCAFHTRGLTSGWQCRRGVAVAAGRATTVNMSLPQLGSVRVHVTDTAGRPISGADAALLAPCGRNSPCPRYTLFGRRAAVRDSETTGASGAVRLVGIRPGTYAVCVHGYFATTPGGAPEHGYADACTGRNFTIVVNRGHMTRLSVTLDAGAAVVGRVTDLSDQPLSNVLVHVGLSGADDFGRDPWADGPVGTDDPAAYSRTDADGYYRIRSVVPGRQRICFDATEAAGGTSSEGYRSQCVGGQPGALDGGSRVEVSGATHVDFQLTPGKDSATFPAATAPLPPHTCVDVWGDDRTWRSTAVALVRWQDAYPLALRAPIRRTSTGATCAAATSTGSMISASSLTRMSR